MDPELLQGGRPAPVRPAGSWTAKTQIRLVREGGDVPRQPVTPRVSGEQPNCACPTKRIEQGHSLMHKWLVREGGDHARQPVTRLTCRKQEWKCILTKDQMRGSLLAVLQAVPLTPIRHQAFE